MYIYISTHPGKYRICILEQDILDSCSPAQKNLYAAATCTIFIHIYIYIYIYIYTYVHMCLHVHVYIYNMLLPRIMKQHIVYSYCPAQLILCDGATCADAIYIYMYTHTGIHRTCCASAARDGALNICIYTCSRHMYTYIKIDLEKQEYM